MNHSEIKFNKDRLRQINNHLSLAHDGMGVKRDPVGFVDVVHHPTSVLPSFNYVTPRRRTALVPGTHVEEGIGTLRDYRRNVRVLYIEELFPSFFGKSLEKIGLSLKARFPLWVLEPSTSPPEIPSRITVNTIVNQDGIDIWQLVWRSGNYKRFETQLEPLLIGKQYPEENHVIDVVLYHGDAPIAVARMTLYDKTAHLMARAISQSTQSLHLHRWLIQAALQTVAQHGCDFMFVCDKDFAHEFETGLDISCQLQGNMLCYSDSVDDTHGEKINDTVEQPILLNR